MPKFTVEGIEYNTEDLSENGKAQLASLQFLEVQMNKLKSEVAVSDSKKLILPRLKLRLKISDQMYRRQPVSTGR